MCFKICYETIFQNATLVPLVHRAVMLVLLMVRNYKGKMGCIGMIFMQNLIKICYFMQALWGTAT
jgi:hypothetical protein